MGSGSGDLVVLSNSGDVLAHERVSESIRDVCCLSDGRYLFVGCKNMDIHVFKNNIIEPKNELFEELEDRLFKSKSSVYTSTSTLTKGKVFLSYSSKDKEFARQLELRLSEAGISCWRDEHDLVAGRITKQLSKAILENDVLLVILSENSVNSDWVRWEVDSARQQEKTAKRDIICPVTIDRAWASWDDDPILKREIEKYHILSFEDYSNSGQFEYSVDKLIAGLQQNYLIGNESNA